MTDEFEAAYRQVREFADDDFEAAYRSACESVSRDECGERMQQRCLTDDCDLRAGDGDDSRVVTGIAVRYGDKAKVWGFTETVRAGALTLPGKASNLTMQHDRALPVGLLKFEDSPEELRFRSELTEGMRQDQALADIRSGLLRGASMEFVPMNDTIDSKAKTIEITEARVLRLSLVDDGAYPKSKIKARTESQPCGCAKRRGELDKYLADLAELEFEVELPTEKKKRRSYYF